MKVVEDITCAACGGRIREFEPDIVLLKIDGSEKRFFHTRCEPAAQSLLAEGEAETWSLTRRHLFWEASEGGT